ncbi:MAG: hypothetical protein H6819_11320 [Phycisphaerales bacterium]|nr:hypothetical protein [Phycisphaerales bacterium]MCB9855025.1 hypothetical protein [Phycisphaerales bacterium]MCB9863458.1 hypothetical protein [Phycisphaerales bacterium]
MFSQVTQFSIFLINKPAILAKVCESLAEKKVNLRAITLMDSVEHGVFRIVPENPEKCREVLKKLDLPMTETDVLCTEMPNRPGALADLCTILNHERISIKYAYVTSGAGGGRTIGIFKVNDAKKALKIKPAGKSKGRREKQIARTSRAIRGN